MRGTFLLITTVATLILLGAVEDVVGAAADSELPEQIRTSVETLRRLKGIDIERNPKVKAAVDRVLEATAGTPYFVEIVRDFKVRGQSAELLSFAQNHPESPAALDAVRLLLQTEGAVSIEPSLLKTDDPSAISLARILGNIADPVAVHLLDKMLVATNLPLVNRAEALRSLAKSETGADRVLQLAEDGELPSQLQLTAATELNAVRWPSIRNRAAIILPLPQSRDSEPLPPLEQLTRMNGDPARGAEVFRRPEAGCVLCHQIKQQGVDFGPALSEIGTKLGKEALFESILNPSAGISFGYEGWELILENGEEAFGIIVSETNDELALKTQNGLITTYKKKDVIAREQAKISVMPAGLQQAMSVQDLVDLVAYLSSLKKADVQQRRVD